jgi:hypothetical protein
VVHRHPKTTPDPIAVRVRGRESFSGKESSKWSIVTRKRLPTPLRFGQGVGNRFRVRGLPSDPSSPDNDSRPRRVFLIAMHCLAIVCGLASSAGGAESEQLREARRWLLRGRYEEAAEAFTKQAADQPVAAALGLARCRIATGRIDEADAVLAEAVSRHNDEGRLAAERAVLAWAADATKTR